MQSVFFFTDNNINDYHYVGLGDPSDDYSIRFRSAATSSIKNVGADYRLMGQS